MSQIHIIDGQQDVILDYITGKDIIDDTHRKSLLDTLETYQFITFADRRFSEFLEKRNRIIIPDEDGSLVEFTIFEVAKYKDSEGHKAQVFAHASYLELKKASIIYPNSFKGLASQHAGRALSDTGWSVGMTEAKGDKTISINEHTNPYEVLKRIAKDFDVELNFRIEHDGNKVTGRYVDLLERVGEWRGREVEFGKDLDGIRRVEKQDIVTALLGLGPEDEDGNRLEVLITDTEALQRWGRIDEHGELKHLIEPYEINSERSEMTEAEARQYTRTALDKRINTQVTFECTIIDLENVPGMENKKIRFGDTIKIKDTTFNPPLYLEARVFEQDRSIKTTAKKDIKLGDFIEHTEEEVNAIWKQLQQQIKDRVSFYEMAEYTYDKLTIDDKDEIVFEDGKTFAEATGITAEENAKAFAVEEDAKIKVDVEDYADGVAEEKAQSALDQAKMYAVAQTVYDNQMLQIANDMADRAPIEYVDGKFTVIEDDLADFNAEIEKKADGSTVYTISEVDNMINNTVSKTQYTADMDGIVTDLNSQGTRIGQNETAIGLKADSSELDAVENSLTTKIGNVEVTAEGAKMSASEVRADLDGLEIGGRNLIKEGLTSSGVTISKQSDGSYKITNPTKSNWGRAVSQTTVLEPNQTYTASMEVLSRVGSYAGIGFREGSSDYGNHTLAVTKGKVSTTYKNTTASPKTVTVWIKLYYEGSRYNKPTDNASIHIRGLQVEKGTVATDWSPSPEDVDASINQVSGRVETLDGSVTTLAGEVSLKASQSVVDSLEGRVSTAEGELQVLPGQINAKVSKDGVINAIEMSPESTKFSAGRVEFAGHVFGKDATFDGNVSGVTGTFGDVTVTDGDFKLKKDGLEYSATPRRNLIKDHSFEMVRYEQDSVNANYMWADPKKVPALIYVGDHWEFYGSPKLALEWNPMNYRALPTFGKKALVVRDADFCRQQLWEGIAAEQTYTISAHFKRQWNLAAGMPRFEVDYVGMAGGTPARTRLINKIFDTIPSDYSIVRLAATFTVPKDFNFGNADYIEIKFSGGNKNWIQVDGVQLVEGDIASPYLDEDGVWDILNSEYESPQPLWEGAVYLADIHTIKPHKTLGECQNGWVLEWCSYTPGTGVDRGRDVQYTFIPYYAYRDVSHRDQFYRGGVNTWSYKFFYVDDDTIRGHSSNGNGDNRFYALSGVYEW